MKVYKKQILIILTLFVIIFVTGTFSIAETPHSSDDISAPANNDTGEQPQETNDGQNVSSDENTGADVPHETPEPEEPEPVSRIINPYADVDWDTYGQFRASLHLHTTFTDGRNTLRDMIIDLYNKGFDIAAITDHSTTTGMWDSYPDFSRSYFESRTTAVFTSEELIALRTGFFDTSDFPGTYTDRREQSNGMIGIRGTNEIHASLGYQEGIFTDHHINAFFADVPGNIGNGKTMAEVIQYVQDAGGITHINHPGRYTGARNNADLAANPINVERYVQLFTDFPSLVGMEIISKWDFDSANDRIFWDHVLMQTMPQSRPVWVSQAMMLIHCPPTDTRGMLC